MKGLTGVEDRLGCPTAAMKHTRRSPWAALTTRWPQGRLFAKVLSVSVLNQAVSSGTNFALGLYLVYVLTPTEFGLYGSGFAVSLFYAGVGNALFLTQMVVHASDKAAEDRLPYAARMLVLLGLFCLATVLLTSLFFLAGGFLWELVADYASFGLAVTAASVAFVLRDFFVRHAYNIRREGGALTINSVGALLLATMLFGQHHYWHRLSVERALWIYAFAHGSAAVCGGFLARLPFHGITKRALLSDTSEAWAGGLWASFTNLVHSIRVQAYTIIAATLIGPLGVAKLNAARLLVAPAVMLTPALALVAMPRLASMRVEGSRTVIRTSLAIAMGLLGVAVLYSVVLLSTYDWIVPMALRDKYSDLFSITLLWCGYACVLAMSNGQELGIQVLRRFKQQTMAHGVSAVTSLVAVYVLMVSYGPKGALVGMTVGELTLVSSLFVGLRFGCRERRCRSASASPAPDVMSHRW